MRLREPDISPVLANATRAKAIMGKGNKTDKWMIEGWPCFCVMGHCFQSGYLLES